MESATQPPYLSRMQYTGAVAAYVLVTFGLTAALLSQQYGAGAASFAIWCTSPVFWWACWALRRRRSRSRAYQRSAFIIAALLAVALPLFHLAATSAAKSSSTGGMAYLTLPLVLLIATMIATSAGGAAASISERRADT